MRALTQRFGAACVCRAAGFSGIFQRNGRVVMAGAAANAASVGGGVVNVSAFAPAREVGVPDGARSA